MGLQINLRGMDAEQIGTFLANTKRRGMPVGLFGSADNARNFRNWQYSPIATGVEHTEAMIQAAIDVRLPLALRTRTLTKWVPCCLLRLMTRWAVNDLLWENRQTARRGHNRQTARRGRAQLVFCTDALARCPPVRATVRVQYPMP